MYLHRIYTIIAAAAMATAAEAQFVDIDWQSEDSVAPCYMKSYDVGRSYLSYDYTLSVDYPETELATAGDLAKYDVDPAALCDSFPVTLSLGVYRKNGRLDVSVFPFALKDGKVVKLMSFKPALKKTIKQGAATSSLGYSTRSVLTQSRSTAADRYAEHSLLASGKWVKIRVQDSGVYELTKSRLQSMGFSDPDKVRLFGYNLPVLPEYGLESQADDMMELPLWRKSNGSLLFYSCGTVSWSRNLTQSMSFVHTNNPYSKYVYYFLTDNDDSAPMSFPVTEVDASSVSASESLTTTEAVALVESDEYSFLNSGRTFYESYDFANGNQKTYRLSLPGISSSTASLKVKFASTGESTSTLTVSDASSTIGTMSLSKVRSSYYKATDDNRTYTWSSATDDNRITLAHTRASGVGGHLDYLQAAYSRSLDLTGLTSLPVRLPYTSSKTQYTIKIAGASSDTRVWDVTEGNAFSEVSGTLQGTEYDASVVESNYWYKKQYIAVNTNSTFPSPEVVGTVENQDLHALSNVDLLIIVPASGALTAQAERLAEAHFSHDGTRCAVVRADQVYNEFSSGTPDATAYRRIMKMLYDRAEYDDNAPKNLLLFGACLWDNRFVTSALSRYSQDDYLLCYESDNSVSQTDSYILEEYFTLLDDGEGSKVLQEKPDAGVGRIPVTTAAEAKGVVDKLIAYMNNEEAGAWKNTICLLADDGNSQIHVKDAEAVISQTEKVVPTHHIKRIYWDTYPLVATSTGNSYPDVTTVINKQMHDGALIMNYTGHGAAYCLSHEMVMKRSDFESWSSPRLPLWVTAACDVSPFDMNEENIGTTALLNEKGAAMGLLTTTRTVYSSQNRVINLNFMKYVLATNSSGRQYSIGEALALAKSDIVTSVANSNISNTQTTAFRNAVNKAHFIFLGDPAISLALPTYKVKVDSFGGVDYSDTESEADTATVYTGKTVSVKGHIVDEDGNVAESFSGLVSPIVYDSKQTVKMRNNIGEELYSNSITSYDEHITELFSGTDSVRNGRFEFSFPVPMDISYSKDNGLLSLYAVSSDKSVEANGTFDTFVYGSGEDADVDTIGPNIEVYLNKESFKSGDKVNESPVLFAYLSDDDGINTSGTGIGHDIVAIIDNEESMTYTLNSYFTTDLGSYTSGSLTYALENLPTGKHSLLLRAWDTKNNSSSKEIVFNVVEGLAPEIESLRCNSPVRETAIFTIVNDRPQSDLNVRLDVYDITGRRVWYMSDQLSSDTGTVSYTWDMSASASRLNAGVYICKAHISTQGGDVTTKSCKFIVLGQSAGE